ncbi:unnamed protein product, partial [Trichobilharzia szidati]
MNDTLRNKFLTLHNDVRQTVRNGQLKGQPIAISIKPMKYNLELEKKAQTLSEQCRAGHDRAVERKISPFPYVGQNWAGASTIELGFKSWLDEHKYYDYFRSYCEEGQCNEYTQIVWEETTDIGCSVTECPNSPFRLSIVCNYGPGGNYVAKEPYITKEQQKETDTTKKIEFPKINQKHTTKKESETQTTPKTTTTKIYTTHRKIAKKIKEKETTTKTKCSTTTTKTTTKKPTKRTTTTTRRTTRATTKTTPKTTRTTTTKTTTKKPTKR